MVGIDPQACDLAWRKTYEARTRGELGDIAAQLTSLAAQLETPLDAALLAHAVGAYGQFVADALVPVSDAVAALEHLSSRGLTIGLVSNANPDVARAWAQSPLARFTSGLHKPALEIESKPTVVR